ncbi:MAG: substrate-binding periplasmic protein [Candidatus Thorarchaeota archaeon]
MSRESAVIRREIAIIAIIAGLGIGILGGWFIPSPITAPRVSLLNQIIARGEFLVGTSADYPPFENKTFPGGQIVGFDVDLSQMIADEISAMAGKSISLTMVDIPFDSLIAACKAGTVDMLAAGMTYTTERAAQLAASVTYINVTQVVVARNDSSITITDINNLTAYTVGVQSGTVMFDELGPGGLNMTVGGNLKVFDNANDLMVALDGGLIELAYIDGPVFDAWEGVYDIKVILSTPPDPFALWTRHGEPELLYVMNKVIFEGYHGETIFPVINLWFGNYSG